MEESNGIITRTERGLSITGTRITIYDILGYLKASWPPSLIQHWLNLTPEQLQGALAYIAAHTDEVEQEYQTVLAHAEEHQAYWEQRTEAVRAYVATLPPIPGKEDLYRKLQARKAALGMK